MLSKLIEQLTVKKGLIGSSILRIGIGLVILYNYSINYSQRHFLWGSDGISKTPNLNEYMNFSIYQFIDSTLYFDIIYHLGIILAFLFAVGYKTVYVSILNYIFVFSLQQENGLILDGGSNIMIIVLFYMIFMKTNAYFSLDSQKYKETDKQNFYLCSIHNMALLAIIAQLSILYLNSALYKVMGETWQNGTAIYNILQVKDFNLPWLTDLIISSDTLVVISTYVTLLVQLAFPFMLFNKYTKYLMLLILVPMHIGIAFAMGLLTFSFIMIILDSLLITDKDYKILGNYVKSRFLKKNKSGIVEEEVKVYEGEVNHLAKS
ncbi:hypothetical protein SSIL_3726 [Solibacillus silvestris StLB046]|uniref:HTTM-like domain-containing protein n=1 Tax=Solibacillus silvestris (strain StLB046) TaxID=1002809 RepID=F2F573_SOLSS|nr:HTTM domain-containing protein [Solibacillus silvestris]BAK18149.1 hypothetical protein SSIL_3726 [Solibacillus silvestris StLB046]